MARLARPLCRRNQHCHGGAVFPAALRDARRCTRGRPRRIPSNVFDRACLDGLGARFAAQPSRVVLADPIADRAAHYLQLDHHAANRNNGGERRARCGARLRAHASVGLADVCRGKLRRGHSDRLLWRGSWYLAGRVGLRPDRACRTLLAAHIDEANFCGTGAEPALACDRTTPAARLETIRCVPVCGWPRAGCARNAADVWNFDLAETGHERWAVRCSMGDCSFRRGRAVCFLGKAYRPLWCCGAAHSWCCEFCSTLGNHGSRSTPWRTRAAANFARFDLWRGTYRGHPFHSSSGAG